MKQLEVKIMGQSYLLGCPEGGDQRLLDAVGRVDNAMCRIRDAGKLKARDRIAVLAALNLAFDQVDELAGVRAEVQAQLEAARAAAQDAPSAQAAPLAAAEPSGDPGGAAGLSADPKALTVSAENADALRALIVRLDQALGDDGRLI